MEVSLGRRVLGTLAFAGLGFVLGFLFTFGVGEPIWWLIAATIAALIGGTYAAIYGDPWMPRAARRG